MIVTDVLPLLLILNTVVKRTVLVLHVEVNVNDVCWDVYHYSHSLIPLQSQLSYNLVVIVETPNRREVEAVARRPRLARHRRGLLAKGATSCGGVHH